MKGNKKLPIKLLIFMLVGILLTISIGLSIWLITDRVEIKPELEAEKVITKYLNGQSATYEKNTIFLPSSEELGWDKESDDLIYYFKLTTDSSGNDVEDTGYVKVTDKVGPTNAGTYTIKVEYILTPDSNPDDGINDSEVVTEEVIFTIYKATIDMSGVVFEDKTVTYDRNIHTVEIQEGTLPSDFITGVTYTCNDEVFTGATEATESPYTVVASFEYDTANYNIVDDMTATLTINRKNINDEDIAKVFLHHTDNIFYYTGEDLDIAGELTISIGQYVLTKDREYTVSFTNVKEVGNYSEKITGIGNYTGEAVITYSIAKSKLVISVSEDSSIYDSSAQRYFFEYGVTNAEHFKQYITVNNSQGVKISDASISYEYRLLNATEYLNTGLPVNVNQYWVKIIATHKDYDNGEKEILFKINYIDISNGTITLEESNLIYNGSEQTVGIASVVHNGKTLQLNTDYNRINYVNNINATGSDNSKKASVTISGTGNYAGNLTAYYDIAPATPTVYVPTYSKTVFVEGESLVATSDGYAICNGIRLDDYGVVRAGFSSAVYPADSSNASETVTVTYTFISNLNTNGVYNYTQATATKDFTMYAVAKNGTSGIYYGTIEKALNAANNNEKVWVLPDIYTTTGFYPTIRTTADNKTVSIKAGVNLVLSYAGLGETTSGYRIYAENSDKETYEGESAKDLTTGNAAQAVVAEGITLDVNGTLTIGAFVADRSAVGKHAVLMNKGVINLQSGGVTYAYGYIKGTGKFNAYSGSTVYDLMRIYDFAGARYAGGMFFKKLYVSFGGVGSSTTYNNIMPFQSYSVHNISCEANVYNGSTYKARTQLNISNEIYAKELILFGSGGMFQLTTTNGYVKRTVENTTGTEDINGDGSWNTSNQLSTQKEIYDFYSNATDNSVTVNLYIIAFDVNITTSKQVALPIGMMEFNIKRGYRFDINTNSFKFLPGSKVTVEEGATLFIDSGCNLIFYDEYYDNYGCYDSGGNLISPSHVSSFSYYNKHQSLYNSDYTVKDEYKSKIIVDGTLDCDGNLGGIIESTRGAGTVYLSSGFATLNRLSSISYLNVGVSDILSALGGLDMGGSVYADKQTAKMNLYNGTVISDKLTPVAAGTYFGAKVDENKDGEYKVEDGEFGWRAEKVVISYDMNGGNAEDTPSSTTEKDATNGYLVTNADIPSFATTPVREGYTFAEKWVLDPTAPAEGDNLVVPGTTMLYASTIFYAVWDAKEYKITYENEYYDKENIPSENIVINNPNCDEGQDYTTYTIEDVIVLRRPTMTVNGQELVFGGWFNNELCTEEYRVDKIENSTYNMTLYAYWYPANTTTIDVMYNLFIDTSVEDITDSRTPENDIAAIVDSEVKWNPADLTSYNTTTNIDGYFYSTKIGENTVIWYYDAECTMPYDANITTINSYLVYDSEEDQIGTLTLYAKVLKKTEVTIDFAGGQKPSSSNVTEGTFYYMPGVEITLPTLTKEGAVHTSWTLSNTNCTLNENKLSIDSSGEVTVTAKFKTRYIVTVKNESGKNLTITVYINGAGSGKSVSNGKTGSWDVLEGDSVKVHSYYSNSRQGYLDGTDSNPYIVVGDKEFVVGSDGPCITAGSLITLHDGTQKKVEDLTNNDLLLVWNHETGSFDVSPAVFLIHKEETERLHRIITLQFSNGKEVRIVSEHGFFDIGLRKYVQINEDNVLDYIGHSFASTSDNNSIETIELVGYYITEEVTTIYSPITYKHLNCFVEGILTVTNFIEGLIDYFELDENMKYDEEKMLADIEMYGLYTYDDWKDYASYEEFMAFNGAYVKVAVGKGLTTVEEIIIRIKQFLNEENELINQLK